MVNESKVVFWCKFMEITLLTGMVLIPVFDMLFTLVQPDYNISIIGGVMYSKCEVLPGSQPNITALVTSRLLKDIIVGIIIFQFYGIFKNIRIKVVFVQQQIRKFHIAGWYFIFLSFYLMVSEMVLSFLQSPDRNPVYNLELDYLIFILIGVGLIILGHVIKLATDIKNEQELVI